MIFEHRKLPENVEPAEMNFQKTRNISRYFDCNLLCSNWKILIFVKITIRDHKYWLNNDILNWILMKSTNNLTNCFFTFNKLLGHVSGSFNPEYSNKWNIPDEIHRKYIRNVLKILKFSIWMLQGKNFAICYDQNLNKKTSGRVSTWNQFEFTRIFMQKWTNKNLGKQVREASNKGMSNGYSIM